MTWLRMCDKKKLKQMNHCINYQVMNTHSVKKKFGLSLVKLLFKSPLKPKNVVEGKSNHKIIFLQLFT